MGTESMSGYIVGPHSPLDCEFCLIVGKNIHENLLPPNILFTYVQCPCVFPVLRHPPSTLPVYQRTRMQILIDEDVLRHDISMCETYSIPYLHPVMLPLLRHLPSPHFSFFTLSTSYCPTCTTDHLILPSLSNTLITVQPLCLTFASCTPSSYLFHLLLILLHVH